MFIQKKKGGGHIYVMIHTIYAQDNCNSLVYCNPDRSIWFG
jgi:hypothetical protein